MSRFIVTPLLAALFFVLSATALPAQTGAPPDTFVVPLYKQGTIKFSGENAGKNPEPLWSCGKKICNCGWRSGGGTDLESQTADCLDMVRAGVCRMLDPNKPDMVCTSSSDGRRLNCKCVKRGIPISGPDGVPPLETQLF